MQFGNLHYLWLMLLVPGLALFFAWAMASVLGIVVVMWAWFGVNLLSVGLHSYGFTSGVATGLLVYVIMETIFLSVSVPWAQRRLAASHLAKIKKD